MLKACGERFELIRVLYVVYLFLLGKKSVKENNPTQVAFVQIFNDWTLRGEFTALKTKKKKLPYFICEFHIYTCADQFLLLISTVIRHIGQEEKRKQRLERGECQYYDKTSTVVTGQKTNARRCQKVDTGRPAFGFLAALLNVAEQRIKDLSTILECGAVVLGTVIAW